MIEAANPATSSAVAKRNTEILRLALRKAGQVLCRHRDVLIVARGFLAVRCSSCGRETEPFMVGEHPPRITAPVERAS